MSSPVVDRKARLAKVNPRFLSAIDRLLVAGMKIGPSGKHGAINKVLQMVPEWTRGDCWRRIRQLRKGTELAAPEPGGSCNLSDKTAKAASPPRTPSRRWTPAEDDKLLNWAGYERVDKIAERLGRSPRAIRFRLGALGMSAKVTDGWSLRALRGLLRVSPARLRYLIASGMLRVRDSRITAESLAALLRNRIPSSPATSGSDTSTDVLPKAEGYTWERTASLLGIAITQLPSLIAGGQLKLVDSFVTDRSFEEFCRKHGDKINFALIDAATRKWLIGEYGVADTADSRAVPRAQKHAQVIRTCNCGRSIAGNVYFRHVRHCRLAGQSAMKDAV